MKKLLALIICLVLCLSLLVGCTSKNDVVGIWLGHGNSEDYCYYIYSDGSFDTLGEDDGGNHWNPGTWQIKDNTITIALPDNLTVSYILSGEQLLDHQGNVEVERVSKDTSIEWDFPK